MKINNKELPTISIVTVVYNACDLLEKTIRSVISQTYTNIEYVIIDGGSKDGSVELIKKFAKGINYWVTEPDKGIYDAMNKGLLSINGDYVQFLNAGDYFVDAQSLERIFNNIKKPFHLVYGDILLVDVAGNSRHHKALEFTKKNVLEKGTGVLCHQAMFVRRDVASFYDIKYRYKGELNWYFDICDKTPDFEYYHVNEPVVYYFLGGIGHKNFIRNRIEWVKVIYDRYGIKTIFQSRILIFLYKNSLHRYKYLKKLNDSVLKLIEAIKSIKEAGVNLFAKLFSKNHKLLCPICDFSDYNFSDYNGKYYIKGELVDHYTKDSICPNCRSDIRHRFIYKFLKESTDLFKVPTRVLHFAPEKWLATRLREMKNIDYIPCDIDPKKLDFVDAVHVDNTDISFDDNTFDAIISIHVLEHIEDDMKAIKETYRVLRSGGWALIAIPVYGKVTYEDKTLDAAGREKMYGLSEHIRMNGLDVVRKLEMAGFNVKTYELDDLGGQFYNNEVTSPHIESDKYLFYCVK